MDIFETMKQNNQEQIAFYTDKSCSLRAVLAIHSTTLGPAIGGIRIFNYKCVDDAIFDLIRLSKANTYKTAAAGLNFGGGQIVIIDLGQDKNEAMFRSLGRFIESFKGRFIAAEDIGVTEEFMEYMKMETNYVTGLPAYYGGSGDHSYMCAYGTYLGILAAAKYKWDNSFLTGKKIIIQGYGRVGTYLADFLAKDGAEIYITDIDKTKLEKAKKKGYNIIENPDEALYTECDIFSPCAVGPIINKDNASKFNCKIIAGSANNQLLNIDDDEELKKHGIIYAPDFIINAGGVIDVSEEYIGYHKDKVKKKTENIFNRALEIFKMADKKDIANNKAAINYALQRIKNIKNIKGTFLRKGKI